MSKSFDEIMISHVEPVMKYLIKLEENISNEPDIKENVPKQSLRELVRGMIVQFEEFRDGTFENNPETDVPAASINGAIGGIPVAIDEPVGNMEDYDDISEELEEQGIDLNEFYRDEEDEEIERDAEDEDDIDFEPPEDLE